MEEIKITYGTDEPSSRDYTYDEYELFIGKTKDAGANTELHMRPENTKIWNQGNTPACGGYSLTMISNGENILEDKSLGETRPQVDPIVYWNRFCAGRDNYISGTSLQAIENWFRKQGIIEGTVTIPKGNKQIAQMKSCIDMGKFIHTGSFNCDWTKTKATGIYTLRTDGLFVGHLWAIVGYGNGYFRAINSYGDKRGPYNGMFKVPFEMVNGLYSTIAIIDKDDSGAFTNLKQYKKAQEMVSIAKELYNNGNKEQKQYFEQIQLTKNIERLYKI